MIKLTVIASIVSALISAGGTWSVLNTRHNLELAKLENVAHNAQIAAMNKSVELERYHAELADTQAKIYEVQNSAREVVTRYVNKEVIKYVQSPDAGKCNLNADWVHTYNAAYSNSIPDNANTTRKSNDTAE
jgi:uncharacterized protein (DUF697 family)